MRRAGIVLCGGRSRRMGRDKALLPWFGTTLVEHVASILAPCVDALYVVTSQSLELPTGGALDQARCVVDREPERGPLAALRDGLVAAEADGADLAFVTATDSPHLTADWVVELFARASAADDAGDRMGASPRAVVPHSEGFAQVLSAVYPCTAGRIAEALLASGVASPAALLDRIGGAAPRFEPSPVGLAPWQGFNTPEAYLAGVRARDPGAMTSVEWRRAPFDATLPGTPGPAGPSGMPGARFVARGRVAVGTLGEVLRAARSALLRGADAREAPSRDPSGLDPSALRITLGGRLLDEGVEHGIPIGPDERVRVDEVERP